ncbi:DUF3566 domain-containing protein [Mycolicibacterium sp. CR10]|uniref:DUF3566 domain-containing protein n=1 Tax=Mycolicibacterium sp. CR10 TaxID=2562314 RepID=UPI0010C08E95|nr:DUF3566 domain-containing protein [Mycolicibacterium sp. CR10]
MSSPNEPGYPRAGDGSGGGNGSAAGPPASAPEGGSLGNAASRSVPSNPGAPAPTRGSDSGDVPPWQRGPAARSRQQQPPEAPAHAEPPRGAPSGLDARLNRFIAGGSAPAGAAEAESAARGDRTEVVRTDSARPESGNRPEGGAGAYASELPDLSGPPPRPQPPRKPVERPATDQPVKAPAKAPASGRAVQVANRAHKGPVRASMQIRRIDPWSALKVSLVLSVALFFVWMIAVAFLYLVLGGMGVWSKLNSNVGDLLTSASGSAGGELVSSGTIFGGAALIGLVNIVLMAAAATIGAFIYNLTTDLVGGVEVTLADRD